MSRRIVADKAAMGKETWIAWLDNHDWSSHTLSDAFFSQQQLRVLFKVEGKVYAGSGKIDQVTQSALRMRGNNAEPAGLRDRLFWWVWRLAVARIRSAQD